MERPIFQHTERKDNIMENTVTKREKFSYGMYFMGQNVFYGLIGYMTTYFTDIGITAALVAVVALITKVWDAINDPIFGMIMDKVHFKKGKFLPWLRMSVIAIPVSTILLFVIPTASRWWPSSSGRPLPICCGIQPIRFAMCRFLALSLQ